MAPKERGKSIDRSTAWSDFLWDESEQFWWASRTAPSGEVEYDYRYPETTTQKQATPRSPGPNLLTTQDFPQTDFTGFENQYSVSNITGDVPNIYNVSNQGNTGDGYRIASATGNRNLSPSGASSYSIVTSGEYDASLGGSEVSTFSNIAASLKSLAFSPMPVADTVQDAESKNISREPKSSNYEPLDPRYRVVEGKKQKKFWKVGRVFMMLWTEPEKSAKVPAGGGTRNGSHFSTVHLGETTYSEIRKFVVVSGGYGSCICSPIHTYSGRATLKPNLPNPQEHAIIYTSETPPEECSYEEADGTIVRENLFKDPIKVKREHNGPEGDLGVFSRLNYSKIYTVENYVRVLNIGMVAEESLQSLLANSFITKPRLGLNRPKARRAAVDERKKNPKQRGSRSGPSKSRAQGEMFEEGAGVNPLEESSDQHPKVLAAIDRLEVSDILDDQYELIREPSRFFKKGRVIKVLWTEPAGNVQEIDDSFVIPSKFGENAFTKIRRFVVVREMQGCCWCLMLNTHNRKGAGKEGVNPDNYAAVYPLGGEVQLGPDEHLTKRPFPIKVEVPGESIDPTSRLNFGRVYTLEHNIRVKKVGRIPDEYLQQLDGYFFQVQAGNTTQRIIDMYSEKKHQWFKYPAIFDTATRYNWISKNAADALEPDIVTLPSKPQRTISGETLSTSEVAEIVWSADGTNEATYRSRQSIFRISNLPMAVDIVFGSDLIFTESIYSFKSAALVLTKAKERESAATNVDKLVE